MPKKVYVGKCKYCNVVSHLKHHRELKNKGVYHVKR